MFSIDKCYDSLATEPNTAYFWSGLGPNGADIAQAIAQANGGTTLEMLMNKNHDAFITAGFDYDKDLGGFYFSPENAKDWESISAAYAEQATGEVHAVLGENVRENSVWNNKELPTLVENGKVNKIVSVDPSTGNDQFVLLDKSANPGPSVRGSIDSNPSGGYYNAKIEAPKQNGSRIAPSQTIDNGPKYSM